MPVDMPNLPPQNVPVIIAQAEQSQVSTMQTVRTVGICHAIWADAEPTLGNVIDPKGEAIEYFFQYEKKEVKDSVPTTLKILQQPVHGILRPVVEADRGVLFSSGSAPSDPNELLYVYLPPKSFVGKDKAIIVVDMSGIQVKVVYFFQTVSLDNSRDEACGKRGYRWKISSSFITRQ